MRRVLVVWLRITGSGLNVEFIIMLMIVLLAIHFDKCITGIILAFNCFKIQMISPVIVFIKSYNQEVPI